MSDIVLHHYTYPTKQINGQRITGPPTEMENQPNSDIELYVSNIPPNMFAPDLMPLFARAGTVFSFRLMMKISGVNRGFGYLRYVDDESTYRAQQILGTIHIGINRIMRVSVSLNNRKLLLSHIRPDIPEQTLLTMIAGSASGVERVYMFELNRTSYASITFRSHRDAALARRSLVNDLLQFGPQSRLFWDRSNTFSC